MRDYNVDVGKYYALPHPQLRSYFARQVTGSDVVYTTPYFDKDEGTFFKALDEWLTFLAKNLTDYPTLLEYEQEMAKKVGPMSVQKPLEERMDSIQAYFDCVNVKQSDFDGQTIDAAWQYLGRPRSLKLHSVDHTVELMKKSTNSGSPYFTKRRLVLDKGLEGEVVRTGEANWSTHTIDGDFQLCATLGWRGQEGGPNHDDTKQRDLWMFPMDLNIQELRVYQPLVLWGQRTGKVAPWLGNDAVDRRITQLFDSKRDGDPIVCTDFTKFDQHMGRAMQDGALALLRRMFDEDAEFERWSSLIYPAKYRIPLMVAWGRLVSGLHGMASGSGGTNADETLAHTILQVEAAMRAGTQLNPNSMCLGDDGILSYPGITVEHVIDTYTAHGQEMNTTKQLVSYDTAEFLRRWHHKNYRINGVCVGVYPTTRALGKLFYLERYQDPKVWGPEAICTRSLSIIENCKYHPLCEEFLDFMLERDVYHLGIDIPGYLDKFQDHVDQAVATGVLGYQYTDSLAPLPAKDWWVYQALRRREA